MSSGGNRLAIVGGTVVTPSGAIEDGVVLAEDGRIAFVGPRSDGQPEPGSTVVDAAGCFVVPGLIDTHVHGSHGDDVTAADPEGIRRVSRALLRYGTTSWLPSTVSVEHESLLRCLEACVEAGRNPEPAAEILGVHVEGPFINPRKRGAHPERVLRDPDHDQCREYLRAAPGMMKIMTLAPELPGGLELVRLLADNGVIPSLGHSEADYATALEAIDAGATHATHLYNAMPALHHRQPNLTTACLNEPAIRAELILDGVHVAPEMARLAARAKGARGIVLVTDALAAVGCPDGTYVLGDLEVRVSGASCTLPDGTIASSMLTMNYALRNMIEFTGAGVVEAAHAASLLPAELCGAADRKGSLEVGKDADVAVLAADFSVRTTISRGEIAYQATWNHG
jgi:N-acetylglucosamine-6-phosphate deacetylase